MTTISVPEYGTDEQQTKLQTLYLGTKWQRLTTIYKRLNDGLATITRTALAIKRNEYRTLRQKE
jgi:hypothetical protein